MNRLRRIAPPSLTGALLALAASVAVALSPAPAGAASGTKTTFAAAVDRSAVVVVATVLDSSSISAGYLLSVERVIKGAPGAQLTFAPDPMAVVLVPGQHVVLLLVDPSGLDFRGTIALVVSADGSIDPDGLADVPATLADLEATYGGSTASVPPTTTSAPAGPPARDPFALLILVAASLVAGVALVLAHGAASRRRRA